MPREGVGVTLGAQVRHVVTYRGPLRGPLFTLVLPKSVKNDAKRGYPFYDRKIDRDRKSTRPEVVLFLHQMAEIGGIIGPRRASEPELRSICMCIQNPGQKQGVPPLDRFLTVFSEDGVN